MKKLHPLRVVFLFACLGTGHAQPVITVPPENKTVAVGSEAFFTVTATGTPPLTYQWRKDGADILGATGATCALGLARPELAGNYAVVVSDATGSVTSAPPAVLLVEAAASGAAVAWGYNEFGQATVPPAAQGGVTAAAAGWRHTAVLMSGGSVLVWGDNAFGQTNVPMVARSGVVAVAAGALHTVVSKSDGSVIAWGGNQFGQANVPVAAQSGVAAVAAGYDHTVALKIDGSVVVWGSNGRGQADVPAAAQSGVAAIAAGNDHTVALKIDGSVVVWGSNDRGQATLPLAAQDGVVAIAAGGDITVALTRGGSVVAWGTVPVAAQAGVVAIAAGAFHIVALKDDGSVVAWGYNFYGQAPGNVGLSDVTAIAAGYFHNIAVGKLTTPVIVAPPMSQTVNADQSLSFNVTATGLYLTYQWRKDGVNLAGATNATYVLSSVRTNHTGDYSVVVSNPAGSVTSAPPARLTVIPAPPVIVTPPADLAVNAGQSASFQVTAAGYALTYQWRKNGENVPGATNATYLVASSTRVEDTGSYTVVVSNPDGSVTSAPPATLTVIPTPPVIVTPPASLTVNLGQSASFTVAAAGYALTYQWRKDGGNVPGATNVTYLVASTRAGDAGSYAVVVGNPDGSVTSAPPAVLTVTMLPPVIVTPPTNQTVNAGQTASFTVVGAIPPFTYQWRRDGADVLGATGATCALGLARTNQVGAYTVVVSNPVGSVTSAPPAELTVIPRQAEGGGIVVAWGYNQFGQTTVPVAAQSGVAAIAAGGSHTVALKSDGSVLAWGNNQFGQTTVPVAAQSGVAAIAAGGSHTVALRIDGSVVAWGYNFAGQTMVPVAAQSGVAAIAAGGIEGGGSHTVALKIDGSVVAWGYNIVGQTIVPIAAQSGVAAIAAGDQHTVALKTDGSVVAWGANGSGQRNVPVAAQSGVTAIAAGGNDTVALKTDGSVVAWGDNGYGQTTVPVAAQSGVTAIAAGGSHTVALKTDGSVVAWGYNGYGQTTVPMPAQSGVTAIAAGALHTVAIFTPTIPTISTQPRSQTVAAGDIAVLFVDATGAPAPAYQWQFNGAPIPGATDRILQLDNVGRNQAGNYSVVVSNEVGSVTSDAATLTVNFLVQFGVTRSSVSETSRVVNITVRRAGDGPETVTVDYATSDGTATAGQDYTATSGTLTFGPGEMEKTFTIPILDDAFPEGAEYLRLTLSGLTGPAVFGANTNTQLTIIDDEQSSSPGARARPVIAAGNYHTMAVKADGSLWAWGNNGSGQLGIGMDFGSGTNAPARVGSDNDWATAAAGTDHTLAVKADGSLWAWGANYQGQLGLGADFGDPTNAPARVGTDTDWVLVAAGDSHSVGLKTDGSVWAWGSFNGTNEPAQIGTDSDWAWIGAGWARTLGVKSDGSLWELNANGSTPVGTDNDWEMVVTAGGQEFWSNTSDAVALKSDGSLWSWGRNGYGQLGDGTTTAHFDPAQVGTDPDWLAIAAATRHTLAVKSDGSLWAWGENSSGKLGLGVDFGPNQLDPTQIGADNDWVAITAGRDFSIGLKSDGSLWSWGNNGSGQLGLGDEFSQFNQYTNVPTRIGTDSDWAQPVAPPSRGEFRITAQSVNSDQSRTLFFTHTNSRAYYILYRGDSITNITKPVDAALANRFPSLTDRTPPGTNATAFYRIRAVPRTQPLDLDHDGIDDYYELRHAGFLHPLNPADAAQDYDADGYSNLAEYRAGTDPMRPTVRHSIASGLRHTVVLKQDGSLWAWGTNSFGQLGDGTYDSRAEPVRIGTDTDWISVSAGRDSQNGDYTVALKRDGSLWAWGANAYGQLGYPPDQVPGTNVPVRVGNSTAWTDVSAGGGFTAALQRNGSLWLWGNNNYNVVPCCNNPWIPSRVGSDTDWVALSAGGGHVLALKADRSLWAWGDNSWGQCGLGEGVSVGNTPTRAGTDNDWIAIAASGDTDIFNGAHSLGLKADGTLWSWGQDNVGELGLDATVFNQFTPARVGTDNDWAAIAVGGGTSLARKRDGSLWAWGAGIGTVPTLASVSRNWRDFAAGGALQNESFPNFAAAVATDGSLWTWRFGPPVSRVPVPVGVGTETNWAAVTAGYSHSLALQLDGSLWGWGANYSGQLGDGTFSSRATPQRIASNTTWRTVSAGGIYTMALRDDGTLWAWGGNFSGQLGIGDFSTNAPYGFDTPQPVATNEAWLSVAAGGAHTVALRADGSLWTWGPGADGQLGNGVFTTNAPYGIASPFAVEPATTWIAIAAGRVHTLGVRSDGSLWACGDNSAGQLGLGFFPTNAPAGFNTLQRVPTNVVWRLISAGGYHTVALDTDGKLWAWGANYSGQLGNGSSDATNSPQSIAADRTWKAVAAGYEHTVALDSDGALWTWGYNGYGQLGIGTSDNATNTPQPVQPNTTWKAIAAGYQHTLAIRDDGTLWSWGFNYYGQLGITPDLTLTRLGPDTDWGPPP